MAVNIEFLPAQRPRLFLFGKVASKAATALVYMMLPVISLLSSKARVSSGIKSGWGASCGRNGARLLRAYIRVKRSLVSDL